MFYKYIEHCSWSLISQVVAQEMDENVENFSKEAFPGATLNFSRLGTGTLLLVKKDQPSSWTLL